MRYRIYNKKSDFKTKNSMKKSGKAVDCFFAENYWLFLWYYIIGRSKDREERGGDG